MLDETWDFDLKGALEALADFSRSLAGAKTNDSNDLSEISKISSPESGAIQNIDATDKSPHSRWVFAKTANPAKNANGVQIGNANTLLKGANCPPSLSGVEIDAVGDDQSLIRTECPNELLANYRQQALAGNSLDALHLVLGAFQRESWSLLERAAMSASYTSHAQKLIGREDADRARALEELAALCWNPADSKAERSEWQLGDVNTAPIEASYPGLLQPEIAAWIVDAVKVSTAEEQNKWWHALGRWRAYHHDTEWAHAVYEQLSAEWDEVMK